MAIDGKKVVIGVDGGGTKTKGVLMVEGGDVLSTTAKASSNPHSNPESAVRAALHGLVGDLCSEAEISKADVDGICLGMAGCDRPADKKFITDIVKESFDQELPIEVINDALVAMMAVLGKLHGILVISGTGSICFGYNEETGKNARSGGWGHILADEGAGYQIAVEGMKAVLAEWDQRIEKTALTEKILKQLKLNDPTDLIGWTYMQGNGKAEIAALARLVHQAAEEGDQAARDILDHQADLFLENVAAVHKRLFKPDEVVPLALWGGNLQNVKSYQDLFIRKIEEKGLAVEPVNKDVEAMHGAAAYMLEKL